ncbi:methyl-accepting chemotaxis protein [Paenibacillus dendritiformis]|uniref:methyl-accepting chemotaxis protein n=1 Tax=Paenibacillus dendritiformis TaxID=130049 RepID=UPI001F5572E8|nr:methyl-accepting chemotaxis protein [Paenibacillus dendritiformis]
MNEHRAAAREYDDLVHDAPAIDPQIPIEDVEEMFLSDSSLRCLIVVDEARQPVGIVMRERFHERMSKRFSPALYHEKPVSRLMDRDMACAEWGTDAAQLLELAGSRPEERMYDSLIMTSGGQYAGVLSAKQLSELSSRVRRNAERKERAVLQSTLQAFDSIQGETGYVRQAAEEGKMHASAMMDKTLAGKTSLDHVSSSFQQVLEQVNDQAAEMEHLRQYTHAVADSIGVIRGWSDSCQMLALNASIEAARAGEYGLGFQVVAAEVRKLAMLTKAATGQIEETLGQMIQALNQALHTGERTREQVGMTATGVEAACGRFEQLLRAIAHNQEQLAQIDACAQRVEQRAQAAHAELKRMAERD